MYLVDTSVWIDFLRGTDSPKVALLEALLEDGEAYISPVIFTEICQGAKNDKQFKTYADYFSALPFLFLLEDAHFNLAQMGYSLRTHGYQPFIADLIIAATAIIHHAHLLTTDKDFAPYQKLFGLVLE